jgi:hypothetical protein
MEKISRVSNCKFVVRDIFLEIYCSQSIENILKAIDLKKIQSEKSI